jgi:hypothetical protein
MEPKKLLVGLATVVMVALVLAAVALAHAGRPAQLRVAVHIVRQATHMTWKGKSNPHVMTACPAAW